MCLTCVCPSSPCRLWFAAAATFLAATMSGNPRPTKRIRGRKHAVEVNLDTIVDPTVVTCQHVEYTTPIGQFTKRIEVPYSYTPHASSTPTPSQSTEPLAPLDEELYGTLDAAMDQETEPPGTTPAKKRNKVFNSATCYLKGSKQYFRSESI